VRVIGVIPARGGSKGVHRKNLAPLMGKPLVAYTIEAGLRARLLTDLVVSTEDEEIAAVCREWGASVPFSRPAELATDTATSLPVVQHAVREMERNTGQPYDIVAMLQPTTPLRLAEDIDAGIQLLIRTRADSVVSVVEVGGHHPFRMKRIVGDNCLINYIDQGFEDMRPRQELPPVYIRSGALYIARRSLIMEQNTFVGPDCRAYIMEQERSVNIDNPNELYLAECLIKNMREK